MILQKNELETILLQKCIGNSFTIKMHWTWFYYKNALNIVFYKNTLEMILQ